MKSAMLMCSPMLQIISGKFFKSEDRYKFDAFGILYSNVVCWRAIATPVATLHPVDSHGAVASYVVTYTNQIEKEVDEQGRGLGLVRTGDTEIVNEFRLLLIFGLRGFFATERREVEHACRTRPASAGDYVLSQVIDRLCDARVNAEAEDIARFEALVRDVLGLRRKSYLAVMSYVTNFVHALEAADTNIDLAYSMLMYGIEALSQQFGVFEPSWEDYDEKVRKRIDDLLSDDPQRLEAVRGALLQSTQLRIQQRAAAFVEQHLPDDFFEGEHLKRRNLPLRRSFVRRSIRNAYKLRSEFVHELKRGKDLHAAFTKYDVLTRRHEPLLTFRGLVRVADQVVRRFVETQEKVETEDIDWRSQLPGIITAEMAPQHWIWRADTFEPGRAHHRLTAFLGQLEAGEVTHLRDVLLKIEQLIRKKSGSASEQRAMACLYMLYHRLVRSNPELEEITATDDVLTRCDDLLSQTCSIESLLRDLLLDGALRWPRDECSAVVLMYYSETKFAANSVKLPPQMEAALLAKIGNMCLEAPVDETTAREWFRKARLELVGHPEKQAYLKTCAANAAAVNWARLVRAWVPDQTDESTEPKSGHDASQTTTPAPAPQTQPETSNDEQVT